MLASELPARQATGVIVPMRLVAAREGDPRLGSKQGSPIDRRASTFRLIAVLFRQFVTKPWSRLAYAQVESIYPSNEGVAMNTLNTMQKPFLFQVDETMKLSAVLSAWSKSLISVDRQQKRVIAWADPLTVQQFCMMHDVQAMPLSVRESSSSFDH